MAKSQSVVLVNTMYCILLVHIIVFILHTNDTKPRKRLSSETIISQLQTCLVDAVQSGSKVNMMAKYQAQHLTNPD